MYASDAKHPNSSLEEKLQSIYLLRSGPTVDLTIRKPYMDLLKKLGNPHLNLAPVIHVAGTNGKGSVISIMRSVLETAGYNVHTYTSPHLIKFNERILINGVPITDDELEASLDYVLSLNNEAQLTFFEITTALALYVFAQHKADFVLLETGLGGRLDCTNVIDNPLATIITKIGLDHQEFLGQTSKLIASEKAGIMKRSSPCIIAPQDFEQVYEVFEKRANSLPCPLIKANISQTYMTNLTGAHQIENIATAISALNTITELNLNPSDISKGLMSVNWPARLQKLNINKAPKTTEFWLDGGHNQSAAYALSQQASLWKKEDNKELHLILAMMSHKDPRSFIEPLWPYLSGISLIPVPGEECALSPAQLVKEIQLDDTISISILDGLESLLANPQEGVRYLIAGSLYLAGHILKNYPQY